MIVQYADALGVVFVDIDVNGVSFCDGHAYFSSLYGHRDYKIPVENLRGIIPANLPDANGSYFYG